MTPFEETARAVARLELAHLGEDDDPSELLRVIEMGFQGKRQAVKRELAHLEKLGKTAVAAMWGGLILIGVAVVAVLLGRGTLGTASGIGALVAELYPILLFRRVDRARESLKGHLPDYRSLWAALAIADKDGAFPDPRSSFEAGLSNGRTEGNNGTPAHAAISPPAG